MELDAIVFKAEKLVSQTDSRLTFWSKECLSEVSQRVTLWPLPNARDGPVSDLKLCNTTQTNDAVQEFQ